jgi:hypothetical protein
MKKETTKAETPEVVETKNIYQKLLKIQQKIHGLGKDKAAFNYKYVTGDKVLGEIKPIMNEYGLILKQEVLSIENTRQDYNAKHGAKSEIHSKVMMRFTWVDTETGEKDENLFGANGQNDWDKGVGSALTYAERYFLLKYFHIATDEDDIDNPDRKPVESTPTPTKKPEPVKPTSKPVLEKWEPGTKNFTKVWANTYKKVGAGEVGVEKVLEYYDVSSELLQELKQAIVDPETAKP